MTSKRLVINIFYPSSVGLMLRILLSILNLPSYFAVVSEVKKEDIYINKLQQPQKPSYLMDRH